MESVPTRLGKKLVIATSCYENHYTKALYGALLDFVIVFPAPLGPGRSVDRGRLVEFLCEHNVEVFHLHWPEWLLGNDVDLHRDVITCLRRVGVPTVWTQHNLLPHNKDPKFVEIYRLWAATADVVIHHSNWGMKRVCAEYDFRPDVRHSVVPHGHNGGIMRDLAFLDRAECERRLGMKPCRLRLGIIGNPRRERLVQMAMDAFSQSTRRDLQLVVFSLGVGDVVPGDARIYAWPYEFVDRRTFNERIKTIDLLVFPFKSDGMLTSGTPTDAIGAGLPALVSDWKFLHEVMGRAGIPYGRSAEELTACIDQLTDEQVRTAAQAAVERQHLLSWDRLALQTLEVLECAAGDRSRQQRECSQRPVADRT